MYLLSPAKKYPVHAPIASPSIPIFLARILLPCRSFYRPTHAFPARFPSQIVARDFDEWLHSFFTPIHPVILQNASFRPLFFSFYLFLFHFLFSFCLVLVRPFLLSSSSLSRLLSASSLRFMFTLAHVDNMEIGNVDSLNEPLSPSVCYTTVYR